MHRVYCYCEFMYSGQRRRSKTESRYTHEIAKLSSRSAKGSVIHLYTGHRPVAMVGALPPPCKNFWDIRKWHNLIWKSMGRPPAMVFEVLKKVFDIVSNENFPPPGRQRLKTSKFSLSRRRLSCLAYTSRYNSYFWLCLTCTYFFALPFDMIWR